MDFLLGYWQSFLDYTYSVAKEIFISTLAIIIVAAASFLFGRYTDFSGKGFALRRVFGSRAGKEEPLMVVMDTIGDTRLLPPSEQQRLGIANPVSNHPASPRFYKAFPDRHITSIPDPIRTLGS